MPKKTAAITDVEIHMYKMGTGDCFVLKFLNGKTVKFKMLIDCGRHCFNCNFEEIKPYLETLIKDVEGHVDLLVVTHEHTDHVVGFEAGEYLFADPNKFKADHVWFAWSEEDDADYIKEWKEKHGQKKKSLAFAAEQLRHAVDSSKDFQQQLDGSPHAADVLRQRRFFADVLQDFANLHVSGKEYIGGLKGMDIVKKKVARNNVRYFKPGEIVTDLPGLPGVRIFVMGPPETWEQIKMDKESGDEVYEHNMNLAESDLFFQAIDAAKEGVDPLERCPFDPVYVASKAQKRAMYDVKGADWRKIDYDWMYSAGNYALRLTKAINNLSLVLAIEFENGKVVLFPGDAEYASWKSWQDIDWKKKGVSVTTNEILQRVVFYKVSHHLSNNGTARSIGLEQMSSPDLAAMATLDYNIIDKGWKSTMPNREILHDLLEKTKGRLMVMNEQNLFFDLGDTIPLSGKVQEYRDRMSAEEKKAFKKAYDNSSPHYMKYVVRIA